VGFKTVRKKDPRRGVDLRRPAEQGIQLGGGFGLLAIHFS
jgi:hypothetical protein